MQWFCRLMDSIQSVFVKGTLANHDIIFLGWTGRQKDKAVLCDSCNVKNFEPYDQKDYFVRSYFSSWKSVPVISLVR